MLKSERQKLIMSKIEATQKVTTLDLSIELNISEDTVRRDLNELNSKGFLKKVYGGAFRIEEKQKNAFDVIIINEDKKNKIGNKAITLLNNVK